MCTLDFMVWYSVMLFERSGQPLPWEPVLPCFGSNRRAGELGCGILAAGHRTTASFCPRAIAHHPPARTRHRPQPSDPTVRMAAEQQHRRSTTALDGAMRSSSAAVDEPVGHVPPGQPPPGETAFLAEPAPAPGSSGIGGIGQGRALLLPTVDGLSGMRDNGAVGHRQAGGSRLS